MAAHKNFSTVAEKRAFLENYGWFVGIRDRRLNTNYDGSFMVVEPYDDSDVPTEDARNGPWCIVGDDLDALIEEGYEALVSLSLNDGD